MAVTNYDFVSPEEALERQRANRDRLTSEELTAKKLQLEQFKKAEAGEGDIYAYFNPKLGEYHFAYRAEQLLDISHEAPEGFALVGEIPRSIVGQVATTIERDLGI